jgi:hypothetical protein
MKKEPLFSFEYSADCLTGFNRSIATLGPVAATSSAALIWSGRSLMSRAGVPSEAPMTGTPITPRRQRRMRAWRDRLRPSSATDRRHVPDLRSPISPPRSPPSPPSPAPESPPPSPPPWRSSAPATGTAELLIYSPRSRITARRRSAHVEFAPATARATKLCRFRATKAVD